jgi:hypothetical protein
VGNAVFVGGGGHPDVAAGLVAVPSGGTIFVLPGNYPAFTVTKPVRIVALGNPGQVVIDTSSAPIVIRDFPVTASDVSLYRLSVGNGAGFGVQVINCANVIVLDSLAVNVGAQTDGVLVDSASRAALQGSALVGDPGLRVRNGSTAFVSAGSIDRLVVQTGSTITHAGVTPGSTTTDPGARTIPLSGTMPNLMFPIAAAAEKTVTTAIRGDAGSAYVVLLGFGKAFLDLSGGGLIDMVMLVDANLLILHAGAIPLGGLDEVGLQLPADTQLWGLHVPLQGLTLTPTRGRFTNVRDLVIMP